jgi:hypothetical protein
MSQAVPMPSSARGGINLRSAAPTADRGQAARSKAPSAANWAQYLDISEALLQHSCRTWATAELGMQTRPDDARTPLMAGQVLCELLLCGCIACQL